MANFPQQLDLLNWRIVSAAQQLKLFSEVQIELLVLGNLDQTLIEKAKSQRITKINWLQVDYEAFLVKELFPALTNFLKIQQPLITLFADSHLEVEIAAICSSENNTPLLTQIHAIHTVGQELQLSRNVLTGKAKQVHSILNFPIIVSVVPQSFSDPPEYSAADEAVLYTIPAEISPSQIKILSIEACENILPIEHAKVIVAGGHGLVNNPAQPTTAMTQQQTERWKVEQGLAMLRELANRLGGSVAVTRSLVDSGYAPYELQVGQTGKIVEPDVYIACGISGAIQHSIGMNKSKMILAINTDPNAPIFKIAQYGVLADLYEIIPEWIKLRK
jgi:electron transfer flavoprotein alpha subunit